MRQRQPLTSPMNRPYRSQADGFVFALKVWGVLLAMVLGTGRMQAQGLDRHGPVSSAHGFPEWYQDTTGVTVEVGVPLSQAELDGGWLLLLAGDTVFPERFPALFAGEHFYWSATSVGTTTPESGSAKVVVTMAHEAAFNTIFASVGDQIVFTRTRIDVRSAPYSGTYILETPYKTYTLPNQIAGQRIRFTEDIGIGVGPESFALSLKTPIGPYLVPADAPGGNELPPVLFGGRYYLGDPNQTYTVTGSPLGRNRVRLLGPSGQVLFESDRFSVTGRLRTAPLPGGATLQRAARFDRGADQRVDIFAKGTPMMQPRKPGEPHSERGLPTVEIFLAPPGTNQAGGLTVPAGITGIPMRRNLPGGLCYYLSSPLGSTIPAAVTARDQYGFVTSVPVCATLTVVRADYSREDRSLTVEAKSGQMNVPMALRLDGLDGLSSQSLVFSDRIVVPDIDVPPASVTVLAEDGGSVTAPVSVGLPDSQAQLAALAENQPPVAAPDEFQITFGVPAELDVLGNDQDVDGDDLVIVSVAQPIVGGIQQGMATVINGGKALRYDAKPGGAPVQQFSYVVSDRKGGSSSAMVRIRVNQPPVAQADTVFATDGEPVLIDVVANDSDPDGGILSLVRVSGTASTEVSITEGQLLFRALAGAQAVESVTYVISDGQGGLATNRVFVAHNQSPVAASENLYAQVGQVTRLEVLNNDTDPDGDVLRVSAVVPPAKGIATISEDGRAILFTYGSAVPAPTEVSYSVSDAKGGTATARVSLTANRPPVLVADSRTAVPGNWVSASALLNDTDADGDPLRVVDVRAPEGVSVRIPGSGGDLEFLLGTNPPGVQQVIAYTVSDGKGGLATSTVVVNQPPTAAEDFIAMNLGEVKVAVLTANDTDPNGDALQVSSVQAPSGLSVLLFVSGAQARMAIQVSATVAGVYVIPYTISDGCGGSASGQVRVAVAGLVNRNPVAAKDAFVGQAGEVVALAPLTNDTDPDGDLLRIQSVTQPAEGTLTIDADGTRIWFSANQAASLIEQTVSYTVVDPRGATATALMTLTSRDQVTVSQALCVGLRSWSVRGMASAGAVVEVYNGSTLLRRVTASSTGAWAASVVASVPAPVASVTVRSSRGGTVVAPVTNR